MFLVVIISVTLGVAFWFYGSGLWEKTQTKSQTVELDIWVLDDNDSALRAIADAYHRAKPGINITITKQSLLNYRSRLQTRLEAGQGPDIFPIHSSWLPMFTTELSTIPDDLMNLSEFTTAYYPIMKETLTFNSRIYSLPLRMDGLAMYYNEDILKAAGVEAPKTWAQFADSAKKMTVPSQSGEIQTSGAALGTATNVDFWPEILTLLFFQQPNTNITAPTSKEAAEALQFYTGFVTNPQSKTWDVNLPSSTEMFISGKLAFYFAPASQIGVIEKANPSLNFKTALVPGLLPNQNISVGGFWTEGVALTSPNSRAAWEFLKFLSSPEALKFTFAKNKESNLPIYPYPRMELASEQISEPKLAAFVLQGPYYKSWYLNSQTQDGGVNDEMIEVFKDTVISVLAGTDSSTALSSVSPKIKQILSKYGI